MSLTTLALLKNELRESVREELIKEYADKKKKIDKECNDLIVNSNKDCEYKIEKCNKDCERREREAHEYCQKMMKVIDTIETGYSDSDNFIEIICIDKKEFIINKQILINNSDYFKAFFSDNFKNTQINDAYYLDCTGEIFENIYMYFKSNMNYNVLPINDKPKFNKIIYQMLYYCIEPPLYENENNIIYDGKDILNKYLITLSNKGVIRAFWDTNFTISRSKHYPGKIMDINKKGLIKFKAYDGDEKDFCINNYNVLFMFKPEFESRNIKKYVSGVHSNSKIITFKEIQNKFINFKYKLLNKYITKENNSDGSLITRNYLLNMSSNNIIYIDDM